MKQFKGTQGEWGHSGRLIGVVSRDDDQSYGMVCDDFAYVDFIDGITEICNAKLIAAAPELLEALQLCEKILSEIPLTVDKVEDLLFTREAIAKALGE